jgi:hypothetical protein
MVKEKHPEANGATIDTVSKECYAKFGMTHQNEESEYLTCKFQISGQTVVVGTMDTCTATCAAGLFEVGEIGCSATTPFYNYNNICDLCSPVANAATVTCTSCVNRLQYPCIATNSVAASCNTGFDLVSGACTATPDVTTAAATTAAPEPGTATPSGNPDVASATSSTVASFVVMVAVVVASLMH